MESTCTFWTPACRSSQYFAPFHNHAAELAPLHKYFNPINVLSHSKDYRSHACKLPFVFYGICMIFQPREKHKGSEELWRRAAACVKAKDKELQAAAATQRCDISAGQGRKAPCQCPHGSSETNNGLCTWVAGQPWEGRHGQVDRSYCRIRNLHITYTQGARRGENRELQTTTIDQLKLLLGMKSPDFPPATGSPGGETPLSHQSKLQTPALA